MTAPLQRTWQVALTALAIVGISHGANATPGSEPAPQDLPPESRQFDFWVGEWDVNVRVRQDDFTWLNQIQARAQIFSILNGKAVLELWDSPRIKGYSLRYFDVDRDEWVLWLNWPAPNQSGSTSLSGEFRHGRGEFFSTRPNPDGTETLQRYSFSDITPESLRWDDAFSTDGGGTWSHGWIMEFNRVAEAAELPATGGPAHTYAGGGRCTMPQFAKLNGMGGRREGVVGDDASTMTTFDVLGGCAVIALTDTPGAGGSSQGFIHLTYNTFASRYEMTSLDANPGSPARVFYSAPNSDELVLYPGWQSTPDRRVSFDLAEDGSLRIIWETPEGDAWNEAFVAAFEPPS